MNELKELLEECINLISEIYDMALREELYNVRNKSLLLISKLKSLFINLVKSGFSINPIIIQKIENLVEAINVGDCITTMDILKFEMRPILEEYLEGIGDTSVRD